jgi:hypothetical protein
MAALIRALHFGKTLIPPLGDTRTRKPEPGYLNLSIASRSAHCNQQYINTAKISYTNFRSDC